MDKELAKRISELSKSLLALSSRNKLLNSNFSTRSESFLFIDELPQKLAEKLSRKMEFIPLPPLELEPKDEKNKKFKNKLNQSKLTDEIYLDDISQIEAEEIQDQDEIAEKEHLALRGLKDRIRSEFGMPPIPTTSSESDLRNHAKNNGLIPSYDLPDPKEVDINSSKYNDNKIQTLFLEEALLPRLRKLKTKYYDNLRETGLNTAYVCFGFLEWTDQKTSKKKLAPLVMMPIEIEDKTQSFKIQAQDNELIENLTLKLYLQNEFSLKMPSFPKIKSEDNEDLIDIEKYLKTIARVVSKKGWRVLRRSSVGIFYTHELPMYEDIQKISENPNDLLEKLLSGNSIPSSDEIYNVDDEEIRTTLPSLIESADSSQHSAVIDMLDNKSFVLRGPPGTGKSQTICNMIAAAISEEKRVLFIAEKETALEVVRTRLGALGLDNFMMKAYSSKSSKQHFWDSVKKRLNSTKLSRFSKQNYWESIESINKVRDQLNEYCNFMSKDYGDTNVTIHNLIWEQKNLENQFPLEGYEKELKLSDPSKFNSETLELCISDLDELKDNFEAEYVDHPWSTMKAIPNTTIAQQTFRDSIDDLSRMVEGCNFELREIKAEDELECNLAELNNCNSILSKLQKYKKNPDQISYIIYLSCINDTNSSIVTDRLKQCISYQKTVNFLREKKIDIKDTNKIWEIHKKVKNEINLVTYDDLKINIDHAKNIVSICEGISSIVKDNLSINNFFDLIKFRKILQNFNKEIVSDLNLNSSIFKKNILNELTKLSQITEINETFKKYNFDSDDIIYEAKVYKNASSYLKMSNLFSIFSQEYWKNRKILKSLTLKKLTKYEQVEILKNVSQFLVDKSSLNNVEIISEILGSNFNYEKTNREALIELINISKKFIEEDFDLKFEGLLISIFNKEHGSFARDIIGLDELIENNDIIKNHSSNYKDLNEMQTFTEKRLEVLSTIYEEIEEIKINDLSVSSVNEIEIELENFQKNKTDTSNIFKETFNLDLEENVDKDLNTLLQDSIDIDGIDHRVKKYLSNQISKNAELDNQLQELEKNFNKCISLYQKIIDNLEASPIEAPLNHISIKKLKNFLDQDREVAKNLINYYNFRNLEDSIKNNDCKNFYKLYKRNNKNLSDISKKFLSWVRLNQYNYLVDKDQKAVKILNKYKGKKLDALRKEQRRLDKEIQNLTKAFIAHNADSLKYEAPEGKSSYKVSEKTGSELLRYGASLKKYPRGSVRDHIFKSAEALSYFFPCWMMTPANISSYLPRKGMFDLVIIDEASQMIAPKAIGAIHRSKNLIVVGDENQLPPTSVFQKMDDTFEENIDMDKHESILEFAMGVWRNPRMLQWHYRSKHEDLIRFQNNFIYDSKLIIPPSTIGHESQEYGIENHYLKDALYQTGGVNISEADKIIELILSHSKNKPDKSLGVAVVNSKQRELILAKLRQEISRSAQLSEYIEKWKMQDEGLNRFFVQNLERVQGDERDVIIVGTVYGRLKDDAPVLNTFGDINKEHGHRRLNVITTRAREKIHLVTSLKPTDIKNTEKRGSRFLSEYLDYSVTKKILVSESTFKAPDSPFEEWAISQIESLGFIAEPQVGVKGFRIDIGVKHDTMPGYILGIECDGATYHSSASARDRDQLRQEILEAYGWKIHRIWSTDWLWNPIETREKLKKVLEDSLVRH